MFAIQTATGLSKTLFNTRQKAKDSAIGLAVVVRLKPRWVRIQQDGSILYSQQIATPSGYQPLGKKFYLWPDGTVSATESSVQSTQVAFHRSAIKAVNTQYNWECFPAIES